LVEGNGDSGNHLKSGRFTPEWVAGLNRNARQFYSGIGGRFTPDFPRKSGATRRRLVHASCYVEFYFVFSEASVQFSQ
jgi:hypothetical protein